MTPTERALTSRNYERRLLRVYEWVMVVQFIVIAILFLVIAGGV